MFDRGVRSQSLFPPEALNAPWARSYARHVAQFGAQVRVGTTGTVRYVIYDRELAVIAEGGLGSGKTTQARLIRSEGIVQTLLAKFELVWNAARDLSEPWTPLTEREEKVLRAVIDDLPVKAIAGEVGVSVATVERDIVNLRRRFGASTRARLAVEAVRSGWQSS